MCLWKIRPPRTRRQRVSPGELEVTAKDEELYTDALWTYLAHFKNRRTKKPVTTRGAACGRDEDGFLKLSTDPIGSEYVKEQLRNLGFTDPDDSVAGTDSRNQTSPNRYFQCFIIS